MVIPPLVQRDYMTLYRLILTTGLVYGDSLASFPVLPTPAWNEASDSSPLRNETTCIGLPLRLGLYFMHRGNVTCNKRRKNCSVSCILVSMVVCRVVALCLLSDINRKLEVSSRTPDLAGKLWLQYLEGMKDMTDCRVNDTVASLRIFQCPETAYARSLSYSSAWL